VVKTLLECGRLPVHGGMVFVHNLIIGVVAWNCALLGFLIYQLHRSTAKFTDLENALGSLFHNLFEKLQKFEEVMPDLEPANPLMAIIQGMIEKQPIKDRDDDGQFVKARIIEPKKE